MKYSEESIAPFNTIAIKRVKNFAKRKAAKEAACRAKLPGMMQITGRITLLQQETLLIIAFL